MIKRIAWLLVISCWLFSSQVYADLWLKQSTAVTVKMGPFLDSTDGDAEEVSLTISQADIRLSKNGGAYAQTNNAAGATHDENGIYGVPLNTTDTGTLGRLKVYIHETGALAVWEYFMVVPANVWDSMFGADKLQVHTDEMTAGIITSTVMATDSIGTDELADAVEPLTAAETEAEAIDALESFKLDELMAEGVTTSLQTAVHDNSVIGYMLARANVTNFARDDDSLQGIAEGAAGGGATAQQVWEYNISAISAGGLAGTIVNDVPSTSEFQARTLATGDYFLFGSDAVANVTLVNGLGTDVVNAGAVADAAWEELIELFFDFDATATYASANAGSVVKQITDNATVTLPPVIH